MLSILVLFISIFLTGCQFMGKTNSVSYYVSPSGNNSNSGTAQNSPWQTIDKVNSINLNPGDKVLFEGGKEFKGSIKLDEKDGGTPELPVIISSYGKDRAIINSGKETGLYAANCAGIEVRNLEFKGSGIKAENGGTGVSFYLDKADTKLSHIVIDNVQVSQYSKNGICIGSWNGNSGYQKVRITNCEIFDIGSGGITTYGFFKLKKGWCHEDVIVRNCKVYRVPGSGSTKSHSGSGIVLGQVDGGLIEYCEAYECGRNNICKKGGPVGIWAWDCNDITIQYCESHHNRSQTLDGGGFDLDGGVTNSVMQYNYSHDNDGYGYLLCQFPDSRKMENNIVRYNISENDGNGKSSAGILVCAGKNADPTENCMIYNNTIYIPATSKHPKTAFKVVGGNHSKIYFVNNIFQTKGPVTLIGHPTGKGVTVTGNCFWPENRKVKIIWGKKTYTDFSKWQKETGQEKNILVDPKLVAPGKGGTIGKPQHLRKLKAYQLQSDSPVIDKGINLRKKFGWNPGKHDFWGNSISKPNNIGAYEKQ